MVRGLNRILWNIFADPAAYINKLFVQFGRTPRAFRMQYYNWINCHLKRYGELPSYKQVAAPNMRFFKLSPSVKQTLILGATVAQSKDQEVDGGGRLNLQSVSIHLFQDWKIFTYMKKERFIGKQIDVNGVNSHIVSISVIDYPCSHKQLDAHMDSSACSTKIIFVYAYMFYHFEFCDWLTKHIAAHPETLVATYFTDSHHMVKFGCALALVSDYLILSHPDNYQVFSSINPYVYIDKIYLNQWDPEMALEKCRRIIFTDRDFSLYGTFNRYTQFPLRNRFVTSLSGEFGDTVKLNTAAETKSWHAQSGGKSLEIWLRYGITLIVPTRYDFTTRFCDALSAGQAVLVPKGCTWLDANIDFEKQRELGIYRYLDLSSNSLRSTYNRALERETSSDCQTRSEKRSLFCLDHFSQDSLFECFLKVTQRVLE